MNKGPNLTSFLRRKHGGLHVTFYKAGDTLSVFHCGEELVITFNGNNGTNAKSFSFNGPRTFSIGRKPLPDEGSDE